MGAVEERIHRGAGSGASTDVLRDWRPAPRDRRGVGRLPSRSALIWRTTRSRTGGAGAIETPTPGAVPDFIPVVGRYRTTATWRLSFHSGMNAADTSAWRGIRIGCVSAPRRDAVRTSPRSWPGTTRRLRTGTNPRFRALARAHARSSTGTRPACAARARPTQSPDWLERHRSIGAALQSGLSGKCLPTLKRKPCAQEPAPIVPLHQNRPERLRENRRSSRETDARLRRPIVSRLLRSRLREGNHIELPYQLIERLNGFDRSNTCSGRHAASPTPRAPRA